MQLVCGSFFGKKYSRTVQSLTVDVKYNYAKNYIITFWVEIL